MLLKQRMLHVLIFVALLVGVVGAAPVQARPLAAENIWAVGNIIGLCKDTPIRQGSGDGYPLTVYVPENGWAVKIIGGPRREPNGNTWWDISRKDAGDPVGGTGWVRQDQAGNCPVGSGGGSTPPGGGGGTTPTPPPGGGGTPLPCTQPGDFIPNIAAPELVLPKIYAGNVTYQWSGQSTLRNVCESKVTVPFSNEKWYLPNLKIEWDTGELEFNPHTMQIKDWQSKSGITERTEVGSGFDPVDGPYVLTNYKYAGAITDRFNLESSSTQKLWVKSPVQPNWNYAPAWALNDSELMVFYRKYQAAIMIAAVAGIVAIGILSLPADALAAFIMSVSLWFTNMTGLQLLPAHLYAPPTAPSSAVMMVNTRLYQPARLVLSEPPSPAVRDALRSQYGPLADNAVVTILTPSKGRISAYTHFDFQGSGFTPNTDVLVILSSVEGNNQLLGQIFRTDAAGHLEGSLEMPDPEQTPLGQYLLSAVDEASLDASLARIMAGQSTQLTVNMAGGLIEVVADTEPPIITIDSPRAVDYTRCDQPAISFSAYDELSGVDWVAANLDEQAVQNGATIDMLYANLGQHTVSVSSADRVGNMAEKSVDYQLKATIPGLTCAVQRFTQLGLIAKDGTASGLQAKLDAALAATKRGQTEAVRGQLGAFQALLNAQMGKSVDEDAWKILFGDAGVILDMMPKLRK